MPIYALDDIHPQIATSAWVAPSADIIGDVVLGEHVSIWFNTTLRGDTDRISVGAGSNIQDGSVCHCDPGTPLTIGSNVTVGHKVMLHGCSIGDDSLIGIGSVIMNGAKIGKNCIVGAGSLVTEGKEFPDNSLIMGAPAKVVRTLDADALEKMKNNASNYIKNGARYAQGLRQL